MTGALQTGSTTSVTRGRRKNDGSNNRKDKTSSFAPPLPRTIQPQHQNWFARFLRIKPAVSVLCFQVSKVPARKEIAAVFREWRKYGIRDIVIDKAAGRIWAQVAEKNCEFCRVFCLLDITTHLTSFTLFIFPMSFPTSIPTLRSEAKNILSNTFHPSPPHQTRFPCRRDLHHPAPRPQSQPLARALHAGARCQIEFQPRRGGARERLDGPRLSSRGRRS